MKRFFDPSAPLLSPHDIVIELTGRKPGELLLPRRAIITFSAGELNATVRRAKGRLIESWSSFKQLYHLEGTDTLIARSFLGGPAIAALVEELSSFGVKEFIMWGYCGALDPTLTPGDIIIAREALKEDGVSYHYHGEDDSFVRSNWFDAWAPHAAAQGFHEGVIWTCDAIYRETVAKIARFRDMGVSAVEMETASFYSVSRYRDVKGVAFLVVSDLLSGDKWVGGFRTKPFKDGAGRLSRFILEEAIR